MQGQNKAIAISFAISELPTLIQDAENAFQHGDNEAKSKFVTDAATLIVTGTTAAAVNQNPAIAGAIGAQGVSAIANAFSNLISRIIRFRKATGDPIVPTVAATVPAS